MRILLTNDDGYNYPGIVALYDELSKIADCYIVAPDSECSATSQAITLYRSLKVVEHKEAGANIWSVDGYPADCVSVALYSGLMPKFDLVLSGINKGVNMGHDVFYSGTVAAARHAAIHGLPAVSLSHDCLFAPGDAFVDVAKEVSRLIGEERLPLVGGRIYNINFPKKDDFPFKGYKWRRLGDRRYVDKYRITNKGGEVYDLVMSGGSLEYDGTNKETDFYWLYDGYATITPISLDQTERNLLAELADIQLKDA